MSKLAALITLSCLLGLTACSTAPHSFWYQSTAELIELQYYKKALEQINDHKPVKQFQLKQVRRLAKVLHRKNKNTFNRLIRQKKWSNAKETLANIVQHQPHHSDYEKWKKQLTKAMNTEYRLIKTEQTLAQAHLLKASFKQHNFRQRSHSHTYNWFDNSNTLLDQKQKLAEQLIELSTEAIAQHDYKNAQKTYAQAIEFDQQLGRNHLNQAINEWLSEQNHNAIQKRQHSLVKQLSKAINKKDFKQLITLQDILTKAPFNGRNVHNILKKADNLRQENAISLDGQADNIYRNGEISQAISLWQLAHTLTPNRRDIHQKLLRAKKVLKKLEKLTSSTL